MRNNQTKLKHCKHSICEVEESSHYCKEICCSSCEWFGSCDDRCTDDDNYCKDERRAWRNGIIGIIIAAVLIFGYLAVFTAHEWKYLNTPADETEIEQPVPPTPTANVTPAAVAAPEPEPASIPTQATNIEEIEPTAEVVMLARLIYGEAGGILSTMERAAVVWCVLNRVDNPNYPATIEEVVTAPHQFYGYSKDNPATVENIAIAQDVLLRHELEKLG